MRLFSSHRDAPELDDNVTLLWRYEVSEDDGKTWQLETDRDADSAYVLRRGTWVAPPVN